MAKIMKPYLAVCSGQSDRHIWFSELQGLLLASGFNGMECSYDIL